MTSTTASTLSTLISAGWTISVIAILVAAAIAWHELGVKEDLRRARLRLRRRRSSRRRRRTPGSSATRGRGD